MNKPFAGANGLFSLAPLTDGDAAIKILIIVKPAFCNLNLIINDPVNQSVLLINSS